MNRILAFVIGAALVSSPLSVEAATIKPKITLVLPESKAVYDRTETMPIKWDLKNVSKDMVVVTTLKLVKKDSSGPGVGAVSGSSYQHTVYAGDTTGGFTHDWALNDTIPGKYSVTLELRECNKEGCAIAPAGKRITKSKKHLFTVENTGGWTSSADDNGTGATIELLSPNGGEEYDAGSGRTVKVKWEAENVPKGTKVCVILERKGGSMFSPGPCKSAKDGKGTMNVKLIQNAGYDLGPGEYWVHVDLGAKATGGKDGASLSHDVSDETITLE